MLKSYNLQNEPNAAFPAAFNILQSAVLNRTDLVANNNKFYTLEIHEAGGKYRLFTHYGRVGTEGVKEARYPATLKEAGEEFERIYREKTGPSKGYLPVEVEKSAVGSRALQSETESAHQQKLAVRVATLDRDVSRFVEHIYHASRAELTSRIETPLGSLSNTQIERGTEVLRAIRFALARNRKESLVALSSQYLSLIPHRLERRVDPETDAINTVEKADREEELLQLMRDVYHVQNELDSTVRHKYLALGATLETLDPQTPEYHRITRKIGATHSRHHGIKLEVKRIFRVELPDEQARFEADGRKFGNIQECFHGTRNCNLVGILSRGLLVAPRHVQTNGAMFGKGIYFADQSTKSALYTDGGRRSYLFLADVALGRIRKETGPRYYEQAPDGYDSVQGCKGPYLMNNEFIVYRPAQCTLRYIAEFSC